MMKLTRSKLDNFIINKSFYEGNGSITSLSFYIKLNYDKIILNKYIDLQTLNNDIDFTIEKFNNLIDSLELNNLFEERRAFDFIENMKLWISIQDTRFKYWISIVNSGKNELLPYEIHAELT